MSERVVLPNSYLVIGPHDPGFTYAKFGRFGALGHSVRLNGCGDPSILYAWVDDEDQARELRMAGTYRWYPLTGEIRETDPGDRSTIRSFIHGMNG